MTSASGRRSSVYDRVAEETASIVIRRYSSSFGVAARLLEPVARQYVENIYALVRLADEIVDGEATAAGLSETDAARVLNDLERETELAMERGYSSNLVVHAFALTAREVGIERGLVRPFFDSMRSDLSESGRDQESFDAYVYGSAEVVGLMCLRVFLRGTHRSQTETEQLETGARSLGAAFQKVNFLRDLGADFHELGRSYFPDVRVDAFTDADKDRLLDDIEADLHTAALALRQLPRGSRRAVALAQTIFTDLARRLRATPADRLVTTRVRVPNPTKLRFAAAAAIGRIPRT